MVQIVWTDRNKIQENSGQPQIAITQDWSQNLNMTIGTPITRAVLRSKHGLFWSAWPDDQVQFKDIENAILNAAGESE